MTPVLYRTGPSQRLTPFLLTVGLTVSAVGFAAGSGAYWWPWGTVFALASLAGAGVALSRWLEARTVVRWFDSGRLEIRRGGRVIIDCAELTRVDVRPSAGRTLLWTGGQHYRLSHRLLLADELLDLVRSRRPDLFPLTEGPIVLRRSPASALLQVVLAAGTLAASVILGPWNPWLGGAFAVAAAYVLLRILLFIPRKHIVEEGCLTTYYWVRRKRWKGPDSWQRERYAAGGCVFFQIVFQFGRARVVLDEGQLLDPLLPVAAAVLARLGGSLPE